MSKCYVVGPPVHSGEWYACRYYREDTSPHFIIGASEAGVACGVSPYKTVAQLYYEKRGLLENAAEETAAMRMGKKLEGPILEEYAERYGYQLHRNATLHFAVNYPFVGATTDALAWEPTAPEEKWCVDSKSSSWRMYQDASSGAIPATKFGDGEDLIPADYYIQGQVQMFVMGTNRCDFPVLFDTRNMKVYTIWRDEKVLESIVARLTEFYERVCRGDNPEHDFEHEKTVPLLKEIYKSVDDGVVTFSPTTHQWLEKYHEAQRELKKWKAQKREAEARILEEMQNVAVGEFAGTPYEAHRILVEATRWTPEDLALVQEKVEENAIKRKEYVRLSLKKRRE